MPQHSTRPDPSRCCAICWWLLTETGPLAELLSVGNLDQGDLVLGAESNDELLVGILLASLVQDTHVGLTAVESLTRLTQTTGETIVHEGELQHTLEGVQDGHLALGGGIGGDFDLLGDFGSVVLFYVRLWLGTNRVSSICSIDVVWPYDAD